MSGRRPIPSGQLASAGDPSAIALSPSPSGLAAPRAIETTLSSIADWLREMLGLHADPPNVRQHLCRLEARDRYTASHCFRVAAFSELIATEMGLHSPRRRRNLRIAALLHDLGKLDVPLDVLHKPGRLDPAEWEAMRSHVLAGLRRGARLGRSVRRIIAEHHERPDGKGYPNRLRGDRICLEARIVAVADAFDAMTSDRPYRKGVDPALALAELRRTSSLANGEQQFDPRVVEALANRFEEACAICSLEASVAEESAAKAG